MKSNSRINKQEQVQVVIRLKPENPENKYQRCAYLATEQSNALVVQTPNKKEYFVFDAIANQDTSQFQLYHSIGRQAVTQSLQGYNCCIFAYGQTGSGKTYSILGVLQDIFENIYSETRGILPRLLEDLFKQVQSASNKVVVRCSYMEIYNQQIFDLLSENLKFLQIRQGLQKGVFVQGLDLQTTQTYQDAINLVLRGQKNRKIAETDMNKESSRSHTIFSINIESQITQEDVIKTRRSKINIVDLAGSERVKHTNVQGQRLRQGCNINRSLHVLGNVINALVESAKKKKHIPFRDSKLTYYLKDSLGGNSITKLLANIQCNSKYLGDTLSTLMFAKRAKILKMKVQVNQNATQNYDALRKQIKKLRQELAQAKYINQTRLSDRFQTENQTQINIDKYDTSNFQYSSNDKPIQIFQENQLHYKALIEIYEQHMKECSTLNNQNLNNNMFSKKKANNILSHSEWKKLQKKNFTLMNLLKRIPAFTKIYRQNQLLKQQRNQQKRNSKGRKDLLYSQHKIPGHSTTLNLEQSSQFLNISQQSYIPTQLQQQMINIAVERTIDQYESIISQIQQKFNHSLDQLDKSYSQLERQVQQKDRKIKEISKRQNQLPSNIEELIEENQYLKLNILELESEINDLYKELDQQRIKHKQEGRRYSLFQQPLTNKKNSLQQTPKWMSQSLNFPQIHSQTKLKTSDQKKYQNQSDPQLQFNKQFVESLENLKYSALKQVQQYLDERESMIKCIEALQEQCKKIKKSNRSYIVKNQQLKVQNDKIIREITQKDPQINIQNILKKSEDFKQFQELWASIQKISHVQQQFQSYKNQTKLEIDSLYGKLNQTQKIKGELQLFIMKEKATEKQFGKSINQILDEYSQIVQNKLNKNQIILKSRQSGTGSTKILVNSRSSKFLGQYSGNTIKSTKDLDSQKGEKIQTSSQKRINQRGSSKFSSRASQQKNTFTYRSPKK